jgi:predicted nucleotidyltransferase
MLTTRKVWQAVEQAAIALSELSGHLQAQIASVTVAGSLVRGNFIENNSDVDVYTVLKGDPNSPAWLKAHEAVRACFEEPLSRYKGYSHNPFVWDDVLVSSAKLPSTVEEVGNQRFKTFGVYLFDLIENHRTIFGEDFVERLPRHPNPRDLLFRRVQHLHERAAMAVNDAHSHPSADMVAVEALKAVQLCFGQELALHKGKVIECYATHVPDFPMKPFGLAIWKEYVEARYPDANPV